jgi:DNA-binding GntR family transcriptional regulator
MYHIVVDEDQVLSLAGAPDNLSELVYAAIRDAIVQQKLSPGTRVSEARLAQQLDVSKTPVREAMLRLMHVGLLEPDGRRGTRVPVSSLGRLRAAYELREGLEAQAARLAAAARTSDEIQRLFETAGRCLDLARSSDEQAFRDLDRKFHRQLAECAHNPLVEEHVSSAYDLTWSLRMRDAPARGFMVGCSEQHVEIASAIDRGDAAAADQQMRLHINKVASNVISEMAAALERPAAPSR